MAGKEKGKKFKLGCVQNPPRCHAVITGMGTGAGTLSYNLQKSYDRVLLVERDDYLMTVIQTNGKLSNFFLETKLKSEGK